MRTTTTKQVEYMTLEKLSSWSIVMGAGKELYRRYDVQFWELLCAVEFSYIIWSKLG